MTNISDPPTISVAVGIEKRCPKLLRSGRSSPHRGLLRGLPLKVTLTAPSTTHPQWRVNVGLYSGSVGCPPAQVKRMMAADGGGYAVYVNTPDGVDVSFTPDDTFTGAQAALKMVKFEHVVSLDTDQPTGVFTVKAFGYDGLAPIVTLGSIIKPAELGAVFIPARLDAYPPSSHRLPQLWGGTPAPLPTPAPAPAPAPMQETPRDVDLTPTQDSSIDDILETLLQIEEGL